MSPVEIRDAQADEASDIAALHCASWRDAYADVLDAAYLAGPIVEERRLFWSERLRSADPARLVLIADATPIAGFICVQRDLDPQWGSFVDNLHVRPDLRGVGIGERLMRAAARRLVRDGAGAGLHLWVFEANMAGQRFYARLGGQGVGRDVSRNAHANGAAVLRVFWPEVSALV